MVSGGTLKRRKMVKAAQSLARARKILRSRSSGLTAPLATRGFYGGYSQRGRAELKTIDSENLNAAVSLAGGVALLNGIAQGTEIYQRVGRKVIMKSLLFRITIFNDPTKQDPQGTALRIILVYDSQTNGAAPTVANIISNMQAAAYTPVVQTPMNLNNRDRFKVIKDWYFGCPAATYTAGAVTGGAPDTKTKMCYKKLNHDVIFQGTGATSADIASGGVYVLIIADVADAKKVDYDCRIRFTDA